MKKTAIAIIIACLTSCNSASKPKDISTVDSNVINQTDTNPPILYLDNPNDSNFSIAVDSSVPAIDSAHER